MSTRAAPDPNRPADRSAPLSATDAGVADTRTDLRAIRHGRGVALALSAIGIVFGDIGTSPLYAMHAAFGIEGNVEPTRVNVFGIISLVIWSITIIVSLKYVALAMRADNDGEGGILALVALLRGKLGSSRRTLAAVMMLGMVGAALFYGDSVITPAISVLSAIEGLGVVNPSLEHLVVPLSAAILTVLFVIQRWGTEAVGKAFGPVMVVWFLTLAILGMPHIGRNPEILQAVSPTYALTFVVANPLTAFIAMGAVVLTITGAEALYADMGHFGAGAIRRSWWVVVFPALALNYFGQGALILDDPTTVANPFFNLAPTGLRLPLVILATLATVIASQAVISGAYSVSRQAVRLGMLPRLTVRHTSREEGGQIYLPVVNWILFIGVIALIAAFGSSGRLASAYGLAVTGTLVLTSALFLLLARRVWQVAAWKIVVFVTLVVALEIAFFAANITKVASGGWLPILIAVVVVLIMTTWRQGSEALHHEERQLEGPLELFVKIVRDGRVPRVPGVAVYPHPNATTVPVSLRQNVDFNHVVHEHVVLVQIVNENVPHIRHVDRVTVSDLGDPNDGIVHVAIHVGFTDSQHIPKGLALAIGTTPELDFTLDEAHYFLSVLTVHATGPRGLRTWRKRLYAWLYHIAANRTEVFHLPPERTVIMGAHIDL